MIVHISINGVESFITEDQVMDVVIQAKSEDKEFEVIEYLEED